MNFINVPVIEDDTVLVVFKDETTNSWIINIPKDEEDPEKNEEKQESNDMEVEIICGVMCKTPKYYENPEKYEKEQESDKIKQETTKRIEFGRLVLTMLNRFSHYETDNLPAIDNLFFDQVNDKNIDSKMDKFVWDSHFSKIFDFLEELNIKNDNERIDFYKKYKNIILYLLLGQEFKEYDLSGLYSSVYLSCGYTKINDMIVESRVVNGWANLFIMDLEELLFNPKVKIKIKLCTRCKKYFRTSNANRLICDYCNKNTDAPINIQFDEITRLYTNIVKKIETSSTMGILENQVKEDYKKSEIFKKEYSYYFDIIRCGKSEKKPTEDYDESIKTPEDLIDWLKRFDESISKKKKER